ncbi:hypothetical protein FFONT_0033 [Fervidicoccus fontis Kam940]|uniref:Uncharacterized protein n=1 Tax=Fervidicoccus fontis (strain DSM 19380 / JCM 18336 / VKM B-2539 / Kam940) TaxID=1163730 RepID=H9ZZ72_FERFK|nr:hypothetical protein FFONT_0033 [Fervidicoccus fontis Kam940]
MLLVRPSSGAASHKMQLDEGGEDELLWNRPAQMIWGIELFKKYVFKAS